MVIAISLRWRNCAPSACWPLPKLLHRSNSKRSVLPSGHCVFNYFKNSAKKRSEVNAFQGNCQARKNLRGSCSLISFMNRSIAKFVDLKLMKTETA